MNLYEIITTLQDPDLAVALEEFVEKNLPEFKAVFSGMPKRKYSGAISRCEAFWLYFLTKALRPKVVIESGTWRGFSLYFLWKAAPEARIISFDPYQEPFYRHEGVEYVRFDWTEPDAKLGELPGKETLIFFDDHKHQGLRLRQALTRGVRHVVFHDNYVSMTGSHVPIRFCDLRGLARYCYVFDRLRCDPIFTEAERWELGYRWLTYVELETEVGFSDRLLQRWMVNAEMNNPLREL